MGAKKGDNFLDHDDEEKKLLPGIDSVTLETFLSDDFLDRAVCVMLVKIAQGGVNSQGEVDKASKVLMDILEQEIQTIADRFFYGRLMQSFNQKNGNILRIEMVREIAWEIGKKLILGERPKELANLIRRIGKGEIYESLLTRRLDEILRYHIEFNLYLVAETFIIAAQKLHRSHAILVGRPGQIAQVQRIGEHLQDLYYFFDPYSWISHNQPLFNITSPAAWKRFEKEYQELLSQNDEGDLLTLQNKAVENLERKHGIQFSGDAYDPTSGITLVDYLRRTLTNKLKTWLRDTYFWPPSKTKKQTQTLLQGDQAEQIEDTSHNLDSNDYPTLVDEYRDDVRVSKRDIKIIQKVFVEGYRQGEVAQMGLGVTSRRQINRIIKKFKGWVQSRP